ncbi:YihY/virulence factor BrkB family protein [Pullulanibacillus sp. KACC 23026]|uniref:YihY/virulence factor BrkB family protein n=1 Tax=Pullulanibacillus sp. KACC 23026 TaxID=3028315 RepID=UPI0023B166DB|nr:YihY/virulence factor BrkB family protein [Pullulanibacillus sp. KACC 23026]WEG11851.1 YihY/virulence factor BrkB family protein [Pullulanibacillus sp. KACC 23026]
MKRPRTTFINQLLGQILRDQINDLSAQLAFYFLLSLFPLFIFILTLLPFLDINPDPVIQWLVSLAPGEAAALIESNVRPLLTKASGGLLSFGALATLWSASNATSAIFRALNKAYNVEETRPFWKVKLYAILLTVALIFVILITLILPVFGDLILKIVSNFVIIPPIMSSLLNVVRWGTGMVIMVIVLMNLYLFVPDVHLNFRLVLPGAVVATVGWQLISLGFSFYVSQFAHYTSTYGSLGGVIILMLWFFLTGMILMIGGEVNAVFFERHQYRR